MRMLLIGVMCCFGLAAQSQERVNRELPEIGPKISELKEATGWMLDSHGDWISRPNRIVREEPYLDPALLDYEDYGLGTDNFLSYEVREMRLNGSDYLVFIKRYQEGYYKYQSIKEGWTKQNETMSWVIDKNDLADVLRLQDTVVNIWKLPVIDMIQTRSSSIDEVLEDVRRTFKRDNKERKLVVHFIPYEGRAIVRYNVYTTYGETELIGGHIWTYKDQRDITGDFDTSDIFSRAPYLEPEIFKKFYYETGLQGFKNLVNPFLKPSETSP